METRSWLQVDFIWTYDFTDWSVLKLRNLNKGNKQRMHSQLEATALIEYWCKEALPNFEAEPVVFDILKVSKSSETYVQDT